MEGRSNEFSDLGLQAQPNAVGLNPWPFLLQTINSFQMPSFELQTLPPVALAHSVDYEIDDSSRQTTESSPDRASLALNPGSQLAPVDRGRDAWIFLICATALETLCWSVPLLFLLFSRAASG